jgi:hypothetical protein
MILRRIGTRFSYEKWTLFLDRNDEYMLWIIILRFVDLEIVLTIFSFYFEILFLGTLYE